MNATTVSTIATHYDATLTVIDLAVENKSLDNLSMIGRLLANIIETRANDHLNVTAELLDECRKAYVAVKTGKVAGQTYTGPVCLDCGKPVVSPATRCHDCSEDIAVSFEDAARIDQEDKPKAELLIADGTYTMEYRDGDHFTFRVRSIKRGNLAGKRIVEFLSGPDNSLDFTAFAMVNTNSINVWKRFERGELVNRAREIESLACGLDNELENAGIAYALKSSRCRRCNKVLTVPASIHAGYGPDCAGKIGL
jgi:hypothetical protein